MIEWLNYIDTNVVDLFALGKVLTVMALAFLVVLDRIMYVKSKSDKGE